LQSPMKIPAIRKAMKKMTPDSTTLMHCLAKMTMDGRSML